MITEIKENEKIIDSNGNILYDFIEDKTPDYWPYKLIEDAFNGDKSMCMNINLISVFEYINTLPDTRKSILLMRYRDNMTLSEIGKIVGKVAETIRRDINISIRQMRYHYKKIISVSRYDYEVLKLKINILETELNELKTNESVQLELTVKDIETMTIDDMGLSTRAYNALMRYMLSKYGNKVKVKDISNITIDELSNVRSLGKQCLQEIIDKLAEYDIILKDK